MRVWPWATVQSAWHQWQEKLFRRLLRTYSSSFEDNNNISDAQAGFRKKQSCLTDLLKFFYVYENENNHVRRDDIYLDFQKAFVKLPHERLFKELKSGLGDNLMTWIKLWFIGRKQWDLYGQASKWLPCPSGVPHDLELGLKSILSKFANDNKMIGKAPTTADCETIQRLGPDWLIS